MKGLAVGCEVSYVGRGGGNDSAPLSDVPDLSQSAEPVVRVVLCP
jgi:hypothetical protein